VEVVECCPPVVGAEVAGYCRPVAGAGAARYCPVVAVAGVVYSPVVGAEERSPEAGYCPEGGEPPPPPPPQADRANANTEIGANSLTCA